MRRSTERLALDAPAETMTLGADGEANMRLTLHNPSRHVDRVWLDVDDASEGIAVYPESLCLRPRSAGIAWLVVRRPADSEAARELRLVVRARSANDAALAIEHPVTVVIERRRSHR